MNVHNISVLVLYFYTCILTYIRDVNKCRECNFIIKTILNYFGLIILISSVP